MKKRMCWLDYWRIIATFYIVIFHTVESFNSLCAVSPLLQKTLGKGYIGTSFFMLLSGFIVTLIYQNKVNTEEEKERFWKTRFARIYPAYIILLLPALAVTYIFGKTEPLTSSFTINLFANLTLIMAWFPNKLFAYEGPAWTLSTLVLFYILFPFFIRYFKVISAQQLLRAVVGLWLVYLLVPIAYILFTSEGHPDSFHNSLPIFNYLHEFPLLRLVEPLLGMMTALYLTRTSGQRVLAYAPIYWTTLSVLAFSLLIPNNFLFPLLHNGLYLPLLLLLLVTRYRIAQVQPERSTPKIVNTLADGTLGVYLSHMMMIGLVAKLMPANVPGDLAVFITALIAAAVGFGLHQVLFKPLGKEVLRLLTFYRFKPAHVNFSGD